MREAGWHSSEREREATRLERDADDVCAAFLLDRELFERSWQAEFEGEVSGVVGAGAFVRFAGEMADVYEGFLPAREWGGREYYELDETETALVGRRSGSRLRIGDPVTVRVNKIEAPRGRVDLLPARASRRRRGRACGKPKPGRSRSRRARRSRRAARARARQAEGEDEGQGREEARPDRRPGPRGRKR